MIALNANAGGAMREAPPAPPGMVWVPGGTFLMGSDRHYPEEAPAHRVRVDGFWIDRTPVTNREFRRFVKATGHVTLAEIPPDPKDYPGALPHMLRAGSLVFSPPKGPVDLNDWSQWWQFKFGADWRRPYGPRSSIAGQAGIRSCTSPTGTPKPTRPGRARSCRPRRSGSSPRAAGWRRRVRLGRRVRARRPADGEHLAGRFPAREHAPRRL